MIIDPSKTQISFDFRARDAPEIMECLKTLFSTPVGTVALDRDFGMDFTVVDQPIPIAQSRYSVELTQKVRKYEPRVKIKDVSFQSDALNGILVPKVVFSLA